MKPLLFLGISALILCALSTRAGANADDCMTNGECGVDVQWDVSIGSTRTTITFSKPGQADVVTQVGNDTGGAVSGFGVTIVPCTEEGTWDSVFNCMGTCYECA